MKFKIFIYHLIIFIVGSLGIVGYIFYRLASPTSEAGLGGVIVMPAVALVYVVSFGILCIISLLIWLLVSFLRTQRKFFKKIK